MHEFKELSYPMSFPSSAATVEVHGLTDACLPIMAASTSSWYPRILFLFPFARYKFTFVLPGLAVSKSLDLVKIIKFSMLNDQSACKQVERILLFFISSVRLLWTVISCSRNLSEWLGSFVEVRILLQFFPSFFSIEKQERNDEYLEKVIGILFSRNFWNFV